MKTTSRHRSVLSFLVLTAVAAMAAPRSARAQQGVAVDRLRWPVPAITTDDGAAGLAINPALIGLLRGTAARLEASFGVRGGAMPGDGVAGVVGARLLGPLHGGASATWLRAGLGRGTLGLGLRLGASAAVGVSWSFLVDEGDELGRDDVRSLDAGLVVRPLRWLSLAAVGRNLGPRAGPLGRRWVGGLAIRPGLDRLTLAMQLGVDEASGALHPAGWLLGQLARGVQLGVGVDVADATGTPRWQTTAALRLDFAPAGASAAVQSSGPSSDPTAAWGVSAGVRLGAVRRPTLRPAAHAWVLVSLGGIAEGPRRVPYLGGRPSQLDVLQWLARLARDPDVEGVLLRSKGYAPSYAQASELRDAIEDLHAHGKRVCAVVTQPRTAAYYALSAADWFLVDRAGGLWLTGLVSRMGFLGELLGNVGVEAQFIRYRQYKSYPEAFTRDAPSPAIEEVRRALLDDLFARIVRGIARSRRLSEERVRALIDRGPFTAPEAVAAGLADAMTDSADVERAVEHWLGHGIDLHRRWRPWDRRREAWGHLPRIAVVAIEGTIAEGSSRTLPFLGTRIAGEDTLVAWIRRLASDPSVRAIVVRIDSPGGSAVAADHVYRALRQAARRKPVVATMGATAASGGYYVACAAERIFAEPETITGSIGIFLGKFSFRRLLERIGIHRAVWKRGANADLLLYERAWSAEQVAMLSRKLHYYYSEFLDVVAHSRHWPRPRVDEVAGGRVWLGSQAFERGLVDELGGLRAALRYAARRAGLDPDGGWWVQHVPPASLWDALRRRLLPSLRARTASGAVPQRDVGAEIAGLLVELRRRALPPDVAWAFGIALTLRDDPVALLPLFVGVE